MALDAGSVYTILGGKFAGAGFSEFDAANKKAVANASAAEGQIAASQGRIAKAQDAVSASAGRSAAANENLAKSHVRLRESLPLAAMNNASKSYDQAGKNLSTLGNVAAKTAAVGVLAVGAAAVYAAAKAVSFNREMLRLQTQAGASAQEVTTLKSAVLAMAGTVPQGPKELAEGLYHIESAGFRGAKALEMLKGAAQGAAIGGADLQATTQAMISVMASQIGGVHGAADAMGQLNAIVGTGDVRMEDLAKAMGSSGLLPVAAHFGLTLKDVGAMIATTTDNATPAAVTLTRLRMAISLLGASSPKATKELATIGIGSKQLAEDMRKPNGGLVAIEDLSKHLKDSGKTATEQAQLVSKAFGGGRSSAGITLLLDEIGRLQSKYDRLGKSKGVDELTKSWAAFQKSEAGAFGELKSGAEGLAITLGNVLLPSLTKLAREGSQALSGFIKSGEAAHVGRDIASGFETLGHVVGTLAPPLFDVAKALVSVGGALGLGNATELAALAAGFLAFKAASFVGPILAAVAAGISEVGLAAATAPSLAAFGGDLVALAGGPVGAIAIGLGVAAAAFVAFGSGIFSSTSAAERNAAAMRADKAAIEDLHNTTQKAAEADTAAQRAALEKRKALERAAQVEKEIHEHKLTGSAASTARQEAHLDVVEATNRETAAIKTKTEALNANTASAAKGLATAESARDAAAKELQTELKLAQLHPAATAQERAFQQKDIAAAQERYNQAAAKTAQIIAEIAVRQESLNRIQAGQSAITSANAQGVAALQNALSAAHAPQKIVTKYELDDQNAQAKLGELAAKLSSLGQRQVVAKILTTAPSAAVAIEAFKAILAGVPASKVVHILHNAPSAQSAMNALTSAVHAVPGSKSVSISSNAGAVTDELRGVQGAVDALTGKTINITTVHTELTGVKGSSAPGKHASGRKRGPGEAALVGEGGGPEYVIDSSGRGVRVDQPTLMGLGSEDYVVPLEQRYRGRALGLFAMLARDLEIPGYKKGKAKHHAMPIPNAIEPLSLPLSDIETKESAAKSKYEHAATKVKGLEAKLRTAERNVQFASPKSKPKAKSKLAEVQKELNTARHSHDYTVEKRTEQEWARTLKEAKAYDGQLKRSSLEVENARNAMQLAAGRGDIGAYDAAKGKRLSALGQLLALRKKALAIVQRVHPGSEYALQVEGQTQTTEEEIQSSERETPESDEQRTGMTPAEIAEEKRIERDIALAALTPDLGDDKARAAELVGFLTRVLGEVQAEPAARGGDEAIKNIADSLKTAQSNLAAFSGGGSNENADLQAQITQANERAELAKREAQVANQALEVFGGSGDIGSGAGNAAKATVNVYTLHPADPQTLSAIGAAATAGIGLQGGRQSPRIAAGP